MEALKSIPFGAGALIAGIVVLGLMLLLGYQAWIHGGMIPMRDLLAVLIAVTMLFAVAYMLGSENAQGTDILLGALIAGFASVIAFYFGNKDK